VVGRPAGIGEGRGKRGREGLAGGDDTRGRRKDGGGGGQGDR